MAQLPASGHRTAVTTNLIGGFILEEPLQVSQDLSMTTPFKTAGVRIFYIIEFYIATNSYTQTSVIFNFVGPRKLVDFQNLKFYMVNYIKL